MTHQVYLLVVTVEKKKVCMGYVEQEYNYQICGEDQNSDAVCNLFWSAL